MNAQALGSILSTERDGGKHSKETLVFNVRFSISKQLVLHLRTVGVIMFKGPENSQAKTPAVPYELLKMQCWAGALA